MEVFQLLWLKVVVAGRNLIEYVRVVFRYYSNAEFRRVDIALFRRYLFKNPFRISRRYLVEKGESDVYTYGETPLTTMALIARECGIGKADSVYELGCGRGRACFWLHALVGCKVVGIEVVPAFVEIADSVCRGRGVEGVRFVLQDMLDVDLSESTVIYLYGTCYDDSFIRALIRKFEKLPKGVRIITVSYSLEEFGTEAFVLERCFPATFTWGVGDVYLQVRK